MPRVITALILTLTLFSSIPAFAEKRVALVIGNDTYISLPNLNNARADAKGMATKLKNLGFDVILKLNATEREFGRALADFENRLTDADAGLVFYAGHGIQSEGRNWLIPSDAQVEVEEDLQYESFDATDFLIRMKRAGAPVNIVIIDACRDNPLPKRTRSASRGLAVVEVPQGVKGVAMIYSAGPGQTAQDGPKGGNGVFTGALLSALEQPGLKIEDVFKETARAVARQTNGKQTPWINASLTGDFYFKEGSAEPQTSSVTNEGIFWQSIQNSRNPTKFEAYLKQYPSGAFAPLARATLQELKEKQTASLTPAAAMPPRQSIEPLDETYVVIKTANVRAEPDVKSKKVTTLRVDTGLQVTGVTADGKWLRVAYEGDDVFVWGALAEAIDAEELAAWGRVKGSRDAGMFEGFLRDYPSGHYSGRAKRLVAALTPPPASAIAPDEVAWNKIKDSKSKADLDYFLLQHPNSRFADKARAIKAALTPLPKVTPAPSHLPSRTIKEQYSNAFNLLRQREYNRGEAAFKAFIEAYPNDPLSSNARYWLGEIYYVLGRFQDAAQAFFTGFSKDSRSPIAADQLLKLGMSLAELGKVEEACAAYSKVLADFPRASSGVKNAISRERRRSSCP